ncbi:MAG: hypothetical protein M3020_26455, partial [Myxococcota bacterium]|nr:hypothetical protein [Myxococcota bacterium]
FASAKARFRARGEDLLVAAPDLVVRAHNHSLELASASLGGGITIQGMTRRVLERVAGLFDGQRTLSELRTAAGPDRAALERVVAQTMGSLLFAPGALAALEAELSGTEIVRFPGVPYEIVRAYWENMIATRKLALSTLGELASEPLGWLRRLHVVALLGADLTNFYRPASRVTEGGVRPGGIYDTPVNVKRGERALLLGGPRVGVGFVGGEAYHRLLAERAGDPESLLSARAPKNDELPWGEVVTGRAASDEKDAAWFLPPRPLHPAHFDALFEAYRQALAAYGAGDAERGTRELARFHYRFVRLHPFRCANQSLSMNLVNLALTRIRGAGMPHLLLDQLALRFTLPAYERIFELAVAEYALDGGPSERWRAHREKKALSYGFIQRLQNPTENAALLANSQPAAARASLILD